MENSEDCPEGGEASSSIQEEDWQGSYEYVVSGYETFDAYMQDALDSIRAGIKAANNLPSGDNYKYYSCFPSFNNAKKVEIDRLLNVMQHVLGAAGATTKITHRDIEEKFDVLLEANDLLLDRANTCMDVESGVKGNLDPNAEKQSSKPMLNGSWNAQTCTLPQQTTSTKYSKIENKSLEKPQKQFKDKIDNSSTPWCPRIKDKPNALKQLAIQLVEDDNIEHYTHPYEFELEKFVPSPDRLEKRTPITYKPLEETPLIIIEKPCDIKILITDLKKYKEIAIDLEHHSHRSFQGITCLMQLSTPDTDYIIDTLSLRSDLHALNDIFTDPKILKVFHGAESDIIWLQKDLSLYIVNMFDTFQAASQLSMPFCSLAYLLRRFCDVHPNKKLQLADWRIRPLSNELLKYAREDVHYLLHIKDHLQNQLIDLANGQTNILEAVYQKSTETCKKTYIKPIWTEKSYLPMYRKSKKLFNNKQMYALQELHKWRDVTARENDDSMHYVLPNHMLLSIAETLPREMQGILACCNPIPLLVRQHLLPLHKIVLKAREQPLIKTQMGDDLKQRLAQRSQAPDSDISAYSPLDIPSSAEPRANLPCLLDNNSVGKNVLPVRVVKHTVTVFDSPVASENEEESTATPNKSIFTFISPFERYKRVLPMVAQREEEEINRQKKDEEERLSNLKKDEEETSSSVNRVHEHFKQVIQTVNPKLQQSVATKEEDPEPNIKSSRRAEWNKKKQRQTLSRLEGEKKRKATSSKANSSIKTEDIHQQRRANLNTPAPAINRRMVQGVKREAPEDDIVFLGGQKPAADVHPLRKRARSDKKANQKELEKKGMLPTKNFDYKSVDFTSFQGGSKNAPNQVRLQAGTRKKNKRGKKGKKSNTKINI